MVESIENGSNKVSYTYDKNGNIETITQGGKVIKYYYNELNELTREDNAVLGKTITYEYDTGGNILSEKEYSHTTGTPSTLLGTHTYTYGDANWKDKLTGYKDKSISYDAIGNPLTYDNWTFDWEGRLLKTMVKTGSNLSFKYNSNGIRTEKNFNGIVTSYHLLGDKVSFETNGIDKIYYTYDSSNNLVSMNLNGVEYYYIRNAQGDIIGLFDKSGATVASYTYDSWGKLISIKDGAGADVTNTASHVGHKNPYRYRGYRYDSETQLYYLNSRYYNPEWGRFINADGILGTTGELLSGNMFAYCGNDPINRVDPSGYFWEFIKEFVGHVSNAINTLKPAYAAAGGIAIADGPLPFGDALGLVISGLITVGALGYGGYQTVASSDTESLNNNDISDKEAKEKGMPRKKHRVLPQGSKSIPAKGQEPNSSTDLLNPDGSVKQRRYFGPDGFAEEDIDFNHTDDDGTHQFPHRHIWDWNQSPPRLDSR